MNLIRGFRRISDFRKYTILDELKPLGEETTDATQVSSGLTLGMIFRSYISGWVIGARYYRGGVGWTGTRRAKLWNGTSYNLLAEVDFKTQISNSWNEVLFDIPIFIVPQLPYVISFTSQIGDNGYMYISNGFSNSKSSLPLYAYSNTEAIDLGSAMLGNGVFAYSAVSFPEQAFNSTNYFSDVLFIPAT